MIDVEQKLRRLESKYRATLSAAVAAKAHHLALAGEPSATPRALEQAKMRREELEARKKALVARMGELEMFEDSI